MVRPAAKTAGTADGQRVKCRAQLAEPSTRLDEATTYEVKADRRPA